LINEKLKDDTYPNKKQSKSPRKKNSKVKNSRRAKN